MSKVGRIRIKLAEMLERELDEPVKPEMLLSNKGGNELNDEVCWSGRIGVTKSIYIFSWNTMTNIVKRGKIEFIKSTSGLEIV
jgi:hypothetical protein